MKSECLRGGKDSRRGEGGSWKGRLGGEENKGEEKRRNNEWKTRKRDKEEEMQE